MKFIVRSYALEWKKLKVASCKLAPSVGTVTEVLDLWGCLITDLPHAQEIYYSKVIVGKWNLEVISIYKPVQMHVIFIFAAYFKTYILISESVICKGGITSLFSQNLCIPHVPLNMANISTMPNEESFTLFSAYYVVQLHY
jgi:hypothetical protein